MRVHVVKQRGQTDNESLRDKREGRGQRTTEASVRCQPERGGTQLEEDDTVRGGHDLVELKFKLFNLFACCCVID